MGSYLIPAKELFFMPDASLMRVKFGFWTHRQKALFIVDKSMGN